MIAFGASPRASIYLAQAARAHAPAEGRASWCREDVKAMAFECAGHRVLLTLSGGPTTGTPDRYGLLEAVVVP